MDAVREFAANPFSDGNAKLQSLIEMLKLRKGRKGLVIVEREEDIDDFRNNLSEFVDMSGVIVETADFCRKTSNTENCDYLIIPGWLGSARMSRLLNGTSRMDKVILFYPEEEKWYRNHQAVTRRNEERIDNQRCLQSIFGTDITDVIKEHTEQEGQLPSIDTYSTVEDIERRVMKNKYSAHASGADQNEETLPCILVIFERSNFSFMTQTHGVYVLNELLEGKTDPELIKKTPLELNGNDAVMFRATDRDIIKEIADSILAESGHSSWKETANLWRRALKDEFENHQYHNYHFIMRILQDHGLKKHPATVKQWIMKDTIGPDDNRDIDIISVSVHDQELKHRIDEVKEAIEKVRSVHLKASSYLMDQIRHSLESLPVSVVDGGDESFSVDLGKFGSIDIHRVREIVREPVLAGKTKVNRILNTDN
jgi:hypothetical protein